ncbi:MAG: arylsulfatase [Verrucomicrobia bacterium]|nr:arylsulfatase [Verrucomicrobiota bacterium]
MPKTLLFLFSVLCLSTFLNAKNPNILIILVDDMGYGDLKSYNPDSKIPTPHLDKLAAQGMRFNDAHSAGSLCHASRYGLMTGQLPFRIDYSLWPKHALIEEDRMTIASLLNGEGYHTAMVGKWHLGFEENGYENSLPGGPVDVGFDSYFGIRASTDIPPYFYISGNRALVPPVDRISDNFSDDPPWTRIQGAFWREGGIAPNLQLENVLPRFTDEAVGVIRDHARLDSEKPLFLYLAYPAPHTPWLPSEAFVGATNNMYGDFTAMVDHMIGRVLTALEDEGMREETLVIFSSDNGPVWYPKDVERYDHDSTGGMRGMKGDAYEGGHRMPFIVRWPGEVEAGSATDQTICFTDVLATFAEVTGKKLPKGQGPDSFSFLAALKGKGKPNTDVRGPLALISARGHYSLRSGKWKYINGLGSGGFSDGFDKDYKAVKRGPNDPTAQLYDMENNSGETTNLFNTYPAKVKELAAELDRIIEAGHTRPY